MKIQLRQFKGDDDEWSEVFQLHFIINKKRNTTYHTKSGSHKHNSELYVNSKLEGNPTESFNYEGEINDNPTT